MNAYSFLPWLRSGIATKIVAPAGTDSRANLPVTLHVAGDAVIAGAPPIGVDVVRNVQIYGPGDVIGVDGRAVSRIEPRPWITNVEPNYLAHIEFYDEDFPWRYSPAGAQGAGGRLTPWLALIVLAGDKDGANGEFTDGAAGAGRPLPFITVLDAAVLPPPVQLGAFAHVHVNGDLDAPVVSTNMDAVLPTLQRVLDTNADNACSRLICPRRLAPNTGYHAFLVPAYESGRRAGLGLPPGPVGTRFAWDDGDHELPGQLPYYHRWFFSTGTAGDFEFLVRLLEPRPVDPRVGLRDMDVHKSAGPGLPGINTPAAIGGVLRLGGALEDPEHVTDDWDKWDNWEVPGQPFHPFQTALAARINLADNYLEVGPAEAHANLAEPEPEPEPGAGAGQEAGPGQEPEPRRDPVITPPLYGRWHARTARLLTERDGTPIQHDRNWVHRVNLDPRFRVAAGLGARIVRERQDEFMDAAWAQVGDVVAANARIRAAQLAREVGFALKKKHLDEPTTVTTVTTATTATTAEERSGRALTITAPTHLRVTLEAGPSGPVAVRLAANGERIAANGEQVTVGYRVNRSRVTAAPMSGAMRRIIRPGARLVRALPFPGGRPDALISLLDKETGGITAAGLKATPPAVVTPAEVAAELTDPVFGSGRLPSSADFRITFPGDPFVPHEGGPDSVEATRFKRAILDVEDSWRAAEIGGQAEPPEALGVTAATGVMLTGLAADETVPATVLSSMRLPARLRPFAKRFIEVMAYPIIDLPMYKALLGLSVDLFVPNLNQVPPNSITLLRTNQKFIESFLLGLNFEMNRELLWREYPTDQRGTTFRQFWDARTELPRPGEPEADRRERLYDIPPIHLWDKATALGEHDNRDTEQEEELVLVIRGELLKKYHNAAVYAQRASWVPDNLHPDLTRERVPVEPHDPLHPTTEEIKLPLYEAQVEPDIYLLGFDLTKAQAKGDPTGGDPGWFFVIKERPGEPRFGLDDGPKTDVETWNDLTWADVTDPGDRFLDVDDATKTVLLKDLSDEVADAEKADQHAEDLSIPLWQAGLSSADLAYILFQAPVLMAVHAQEMLR